METMSQSHFADMTDGPGMADQGLLKLRKISGIWKTDDGSFELRIHSQEAVAVLHGRGALDTRLAVCHIGMMMGMPMYPGSNSTQKPHELEVFFAMGNTILDVEGTPLLRLESAWYENDVLSVAATDLQAKQKRLLMLTRVPDEEKPIDPSVPIPKFCPECGNRMGDKPVCPSCGWRVTG